MLCHAAHEKSVCQPLFNFLFTFFQARQFILRVILATFAKLSSRPNKWQNICADNSRAMKSSTGEKNLLWLLSMRPLNFLWVSPQATVCNIIFASKVNV